MKISIIQGTVTGTAVYVETQTPTTNINGLATLEIGGGTVISGTFSAINWANGPYFIKTETDPTGGTNYTITGTSQLLSVPYALHAKTAESVTGGTSETDPIFIASPANGITSSNINNWNTAYDWGDHTQLYRPVTWVPAWADVTGKPTFATVATSGSYNDLTNKPVLFNGSWTSLTGKPTTIAGYGITDAMSTSHTANGITTTNITNWNAAYGWGNHTGLYRPISYVPAWSEITGKPTFATVSTSGSYNDLTNKPTLFTSVVSDATMAGNGTTGLPLKIAQQAATSGQVLKWNGSTWTPGNDLTGSSNTPGGSNGHVQFNNAGSFGGDANLFWDNTNKRLGIGTTSPSAQLHVQGAGAGQGNVVFVGQFLSSNFGNPPVSGAGTRMMWYPNKGAFRAGRADGTEWDVDKIGVFSIAMGLNTIASGHWSTAMGSSTTASGDFSTAMGTGTNATLDYSTAMGVNTTASSYMSTAMGESTTASGISSTAMGSYTNASGMNSTAMGVNTTASGYSSTAMGDHTTASGISSTAMGSYTNASAYASVALGRYNVGGGSPSDYDWILTDPLFEIGNGTSDVGRSNAMTVLKNGYVGLGTVTPAAGLHIKAGTWPGSFIYLEANTGGDAGMRVYEGAAIRWHIFNDASVDGLLIQNNALNTAIFCQQSNGNVGIGTTTPFYKLQVGNYGDGTQARANAWNLLSDARLKKDFTGLENPLEMVEKINGYYFYWNTGTDKTRQVGFSAQEVKKVIPEIVSEGADGYLSIEYGKMAPLLLEAIKELKAENDELKARLEKIEAKVGQLTGY